MAFTITSQTAAVTTIPLVLGYAADRLSGNIIHDILGRTDPDVAVKPLKLRTGTLNCFMGSHATADSFVTQLAIVGWQRLQSTEDPLSNMYFVTNGKVTITHDDEYQSFTVAVDFHEVLP